jgi:hypothetical protein
MSTRRLIVFEHGSKLGNAPFGGVASAGIAASRVEFGGVGGRCGDAACIVPISELIHVADPTNSRKLLSNGDFELRRLYLKHDLAM